ncbi:MFS transporter [Lysinibacillus capsici]|uniref:MFS transporter n=1 Tax=Lysinibacillus capsici TaxID=2115968 RepID=UPI00368BA669
MSKSKKYMWSVLIIHWLVWGFISLDRMIPVFVAPYIIEDLKLSNAQFGWLMSALSITFALAGFFGGFLSDNIGRSKVVFPAILLFSTTTLLSGVVRNFGQLLGLRALLGIGEGSYNATGISHLGELWPDKKRGFALGFHQTGFPIIGIFIGGAFAGFIALHWGWRSVFIVGGITGLVLAVIFKLVVRESTVFLENNAKQKEGNKDNKVTWNTLLSLFSNRDWTINLAIVSLTIIAYWSITTFLIVYLIDSKGFSREMASTIAGISGITGCIGQLFAAWWSDRIGRKKSYFILTIGAAFSVLILIMGNSTAAVIIGLLCLGYCIYGPFSLGIAVVPTDVARKGLIGTSVGFTVLISEVFGILGPILGGSLNDMFGQSSALWLGLIAYIAASVCVFFLRETAPAFREENNESNEQFASL